MTVGALALAGVAGLAAGFVNALAGGGTLLSFPLLMAAGLGAVPANVTNTVALCPGFLGGVLAQRADLRGQERRMWMWLPTGALGGILGGWLLLHTEERVFRALVPFLILLATGLLAAQGPVRRWLVSQGGHEPRKHSETGAAAVVAVGAVYGGYFGAGLSVILLATLGVLTDDTLTRLNALKQAIALTVNLAAASFFLFSGQVAWHAAMVMAPAALLGGSLGGRLARRISPDKLRTIIVICGLIIGVAYFVKP